MAAKFTPGPWVLDERRPGKVYSDDPFGTIVADCGPFSHCFRTPEESINNAQFISASPLLYEALEELYALVEGECPSLLDEDKGGDARLDNGYQHRTPCGAR